MKKKPDDIPLFNPPDKIHCPHCDCVGGWDDFDCLGAADGGLFCNECWQEFDSCAENEEHG